MKNISIALDGPAGAGKSTIAKIIAKRMNLVYIDTGAMYRAITLKILNKEIPLEKEQNIKDILSSTKIDLDEENIFLDGKQVKDEIREPRINQFVSQVAKIPFIRDKMVTMQREIASCKNVIMDGRDIGTNVLPNATYKFFLTASIDERANRRFMELQSKGFQMTFDQVKSEIEQRDKTDRERELAPLKKAEDAILIDTTEKSIDEVVEAIILYIK